MCAVSLVIGLRVTGCPTRKTPLVTACMLEGVNRRQENLTHGTEASEGARTDWQQTWRTLIGEVSRTLLIVELD